MFFLASCALSGAGAQPAATAPSSGDLFKTLQDLETGRYEHYLQAQRSQLRHWQGEKTKQQRAIAELEEQKTRLQQEANSLTQASLSHTQRTQNSQQTIRALNQQRAALARETQTLQAATRQLEQAKQQQAQQDLERQQRLNALLAERERLRKALKLMINSDNP